MVVKRDCFIKNTRNDKYRRGSGLGTELTPLGFSLLLEEGFEKVCVLGKIPGQSANSNYGEFFFHGNHLRRV